MKKIWIQYRCKYINKLWLPSKSYIFRQLTSGSVCIDLIKQCCPSDGLFRPGKRKLNARLRFSFTSTCTCIHCIYVYSSFEGRDVLFKIIYSFWHEHLTWVTVHKTECVPDLMIGRIQGQPLLKGLCWLLGHTQCILIICVQTPQVQIKPQVMPQLSTFR